MEEQQQRTLDWFRARLGKFTGSAVGNLIGKPKAIEKVFTATAWAYIYEVGAERLMNREFVDNDQMFEYYLETVNVTSKAMRWGIENESAARTAYEIQTGNTVTEVGSCAHMSIPNFASSPDGVVKGKDGVIEIKCLSMKNFMEAKVTVKDNETLKAFNSTYYYQCQAHIMCMGAAWCDFIVYNPFMEKSLHIVRVEPDKEAMGEIEERVTLANMVIDDWANGTNAFELAKENMIVRAKAQAEEEKQKKAAEKAVAKKSK